MAVIPCSGCGRAFSQLAHESTCTGCLTSPYVASGPLGGTITLGDPEPVSSGQVTSRKVKSDGGSTDYYKFPEYAKELNDAISYKEMSFARGNIFKACYRLGEKEGTDVLYDIRKMRLFLDVLEDMHNRGQRL